MSHKSRRSAGDCHWTKSDKGDYIKGFRSENIKLVMGLSSVSHEAWINEADLRQFSQFMAWYWLPKQFVAINVRFSLEPVSFRWFGAITALTSTWNPHHEPKIFFPSSFQPNFFIDLETMLFSVPKATQRKYISAPTKPTTNAVLECV